ncbi:MAG: hypothetical protein SCK28_00290 [Bacillota bacterium]|nr:hypothetical protein [Bacillota bacterium]
MVWEGWPLSRILLLLVGLILLAITLQVTMFHYRQNFRHWAQWVPVLGAPIFGLFAMAATFINQEWFNWVLTALLGVGLLASILGFTLHFHGVGERVDGYRINNFLVGPPIVLPMMIGAMSLLGLLAIFWR